MEEELSTRQIAHHQEKLVICLEREFEAYDEGGIDFGEDITLGPVVVVVVVVVVGGGGEGLGVRYP